MMSFSSPQLTQKQKGKFTFALLSAASIAIIAMPQAAQSSTIYSALSPLIQKGTGYSLVSDSQQQGAQKFIQKLADTGIGFLSNPDLSQSGKKKQFKNLLEKDFNLEKIGRFALGRNWRTATDTQKKDYMRAFKSMIVEVYSNRFKEYTNQKVEVISSTEKGKNILVSSVVKDPNGPDIKLDWVVRYSKGSYKVIDVLVEGVSMVITQRSDFDAVIKKNGGDIQALIDTLHATKNQ